MSTYIDIIIKGQGFSPKSLKTTSKLPIEVLVESGETAKIGRYRGKPSPYGIGLIKVDSLNDKRLLLYPTILLKYKKDFKRLRIEEIIFDIDTSSKEVENILFDSRFIHLIASLNARIQFHKNEDENDFRYLIDTLNYKISTSRIQNKEKIIRLLKRISSDKDLSELTLDIEGTYGLVMYLITNLSKGDKANIESFNDSIKDFTQIK